MSRVASINRETAETRIKLSIELDGTGRAQVKTGVGFFDHMLTLWPKRWQTRAASVATAAPWYPWTKYW